MIRFDTAPSNYLKDDYTFVIKTLSNALIHLYLNGDANSILYADLLALIANNELIPNSSYRITDYTTTTAQADTTSAGHDFDVIVTALSTNELSEDAKCVRKVGDTYFENAKLEAWEIKYCIHNDTSRFAWADTVNGKGVIYYMKDEWNNECPYDFKNIQFKKSNVFLYTFGGTADNSLTGGCHHNTMMDYVSSSVLRLNFNTFGRGCYSNTFGNNCYSNTFGDYCGGNTFGNSCYSNTFGDNCRFNTFGNGCNSNTFGYGFNYNTFGNNCCFNTFGNYCNSNTFGDYCNSNTFGNDCYSNTFGVGCSSNTFDCDYYYNTFGNECKKNTFGSSCHNNTFGDECKNNTFGNNYYDNTFGNNCQYNNFYHGSSGTTKKDYIRYIVLEDGCINNNFYSEVTTDIDNYLQRIRIKGLENNTPTNIQITLSEVDTNYEWVICYTSGGTLKQYCPDNNDSYKLENIEVSTWNDSNTYTDFGYQAQIDIDNLSESDFVNVVFGVNEAVSGNYAPAIEIYSGYILVFSKVNTAITIPTIEITKIDL
ncbi:MAG: hypothetical protein BWY47_01473 [Bacteroidetes bacterium ADurb.Bin302]|nr:MAG: hypothetical protein BWY47_01473 [Bacteroidetes bacterium ADurb.Bin302]